MKELLEFERYLAHLGEGLGHADRPSGLRGHCTGLLSPLKRKSVEPMTSHLAPLATRSRHPSLHHQVTVWPPGHAPLPPEPYSGQGNVPSRQRLGDAKHQRPQTIKALAFELDPAQWQSLEWREGTNVTLRSRFARVRVHAANRDQQRPQLRSQLRPQAGSRRGLPLSHWR